MSDSLQPGRHPWHSLGQYTRVLSLSLLQAIFPTQGLNPDLLHCRQTLYQLNHKGSPRKLEWVAYPFSSGSSWPRNQTGVSCIAGRFFTSWATREAHNDESCNYKDFLTFTNRMKRYVRDIKYSISWRNSFVITNSNVPEYLKQNEERERKSKRKKQLSGLIVVGWEKIKGC